MDPITVLLVEDKPRTRRRIASAIEAASGLRLVGTAANVAEGRSALERETPDVLLTDLGLPDGSGIELIREVRQRGRPTQSMVVTVFADEDHVISAIEAGAAGYLLKDALEDEIVDSISELAGGGSPISPSIARHILRRFRAAAEPAQEKSGPGLSERELEVLSLVAKGFSSPEIARILDLSPHTIKTHVRHIYGKLEVGSRGEAVYEAVQRGILREI
ncbi:MAG TPA: response regulator transcription factor [Deltaproteobacteria bacterium]|nr:response regulator transcription factor [Deltaproteobacteria bacterium]